MSEPGPSAERRAPTRDDDPRRLLRRLDRTEAMVDALVSAAPLGVGYLDTDLRYLLVNGALAEINGLSPEEHFGRSVRELLPEMADEVEPVLREVLRTGTSAVEVEVSGATPARPGEVRHWLATFYRLENQGGVHGVGLVVGEVTEQRRAERRLRQLIDGLFTFVGLCAPDGTLLEANRAALDAAGLDTEDVLGHPFWEAYWWSYDSEVQEQLRVAIGLAQNGVISRYDVDVRVKGERRITIDFQLVPLVEDGHVVALVPSGMDVTDRHRHTLQVQATAELTRRLSAAADTSGAVAAVLDRAPDALACDFVNVALCVEGGELQLHHPGALDDAVAARFDVVALDAPTPISDAVREQRLVVARPGSGADPRYAGIFTAAAGSGLGTLAAAPLIDRGRAVGAIGVGWNDDRELSAADIARLDTIADLCSQTLERTRLADAHAEFLANLQRRLLPAPPERPNLEIEVCYEPATETLGFGGDWYDVVPLGPHRTAVVVGDVTGHGIDAAASMSHVRGLLNALIRTGVELDDLLHSTAVALCDTGESFVGTAAVVVVDTLAGKCAHVSAGHPHPVLVPRAGPARVVDGGRARVLGLRVGRVEVAQERFEPGDVLVLCSDGLIERRDRDVVEGLEELRALVDGAPRSASEVLARIESTFVDPMSRRDDLVCVVVERTA